MGNEEMNMDSVAVVTPHSVAPLFRCTNTATDRTREKQKKKERNQEKKDTEREMKRNEWENSGVKENE